MTSVVTIMRDLDEALARAVQLEVEAKNWRIKSGQWRRKYEQAADEMAELKKQLQFTQDTANELIKMVDAVRAERDTWRAQASQ